MPGQHAWAMAFHLRLVGIPNSSPPAVGRHGMSRRSVRGLTLRLADKELTPPSQGRQAVGVALPLLLEKGGLGWGRQTGRPASSAWPSGPAALLVYLTSRHWRVNRRACPVMWPAKPCMPPFSCNHAHASFHCMPSYLTSHGNFPTPAPAAAQQRLHPPANCPRPARSRRPALGCRGSATALAGHRLQAGGGSGPGAAAAPHGTAGAGAARGPQVRLPASRGFTLMVLRVEGCRVV